ncbi:hypothetical protein CVM73_03470 [Bradyrhizobium forestalis]|uniref:Uncharacterized protein n=1 Tax=Bradyrhizobium forestalis TaxID=1419263 RepID=A0A2M8RFN0_9BRAD|nr:hypothetical protein CVM73_03470 [Bradyrhizobium forestalis]
MAKLATSIRHTIDRLYPDVVTRQQMTTPTVGSRQQLTLAVLGQHGVSRDELLSALAPLWEFAAMRFEPLPTTRAAAPLSIWRKSSSNGSRE